MTVRLELGDCLELLPQLRREGVLADAVVTDPPYHLVSVTKRLGDPASAPIKHGSDGAFARASRGFMGQSWDGGDVAFRPDTWKKVMDVMKPGAWLVAFGGTRTFDLLAAAVRAAGFEVRDRLWNAIAADSHVERFLDSLSAEQRDAFALAVEGSQFGGELTWIFGSGFPKPATTAGKAIDKHLGVSGQLEDRREVLPISYRDGQSLDQSCVAGTYVPAASEAAAWAGWGFALKPANEPILLARKPLAGDSAAANLLRHGTGAHNVDGCRVEGGAGTTDGPGRLVDQGRWPANVVHDGSDEVLALFPETNSGGYPPPGGQRTRVAVFGDPSVRGEARFGSSSGSAARFFYSAKASDSERVYRCRQCGAHRLGKPKCGHRDERGNLDLQSHPTVKPLALMRWLVRLVCPPGGLVLDPFAGTGTTGAAALAERCGALLIERERSYAADICVRLGLPLGELAPPPPPPARPPSDHGPLFRGEAHA